MFHSVPQHPTKGDPERPRSDMWSRALSSLIWSYIKQRSEGCGWLNNVVFDLNTPVAHFQTH